MAAKKDGEALTLEDVVGILQSGVAGMSREEATRFFVDVLRTAAYLDARAEQELTAQVFQHIRDLRIAGTPFEVRNMEEWDKFSDQMRKLLVGGTTMVVAMAIKSPPVGVRP